MNVNQTVTNAIDKMAELQELLSLLDDNVETNSKLTDICDNLACTADCFTEMLNVDNSVDTYVHVTCWNHGVEA